MDREVYVAVWADAAQLGCYVVDDWFALSFNSGSPRSHDWLLRTMAYNLCTAAISATWLLSSTSAYLCLVSLRELQNQWIQSKTYFLGNCLYLVFLRVVVVQTRPSSLHLSLAWKLFVTLHQV